MSGQDSSGSHCEVGETKLTAVEGHLVSLQVEENGRFEGQWIWNSLVTSVWVFVQYIVDAPIEEKKREGIIRYYRGRQRTDGSWGWHEESGGYLTTTTMAYVSLRLLGVSPDDPGMQKALDWIHAQPDGVQSIPMLGKFWLACINLFDWSGVKIVPAELWLLPSRFYTFFRLAIMSLMYVSGVRFQKPASPVIVELQAELYRGEFEKIDWPACRFLVAGSDLYGSSPSFLRKALDLLHFYDRNPPAKPRRRALAKCLEQIVYEERTSRNHSNTPLTGLMNCVALYAHDPGHEELEPSVSGKEAWKVEDEEGIRYVASRSGVWDTAFAMQALLESPSREANKDTLARAYNFLVGSQIIDEFQDLEAHARESNAGSWSFGGLSELGGQLGWPVTDCTAESVVALLMMHRYLPDSPVERISEERLALATEFLLGRQNRNGSYGQYESCRDWWILPRINITEVFGGNITVDYSCCECTGSCLVALAMLRDALPAFRDRIDRAIRRAVAWEKSTQQEDGSFYAEWGINYTYGAFFAVKGLRAAGVDPSDPVLVKAAQ